MVLAVHMYRVWVLAPCRVIDVSQGRDRVGFTYATLPGHPERGVEEFVFRRDGGRLWFELSAVSTAAFWGSRLVPRVANRVQSAIAGRYLGAARALASLTA